MLTTADGFKDYLEEHWGPLDNQGLWAQLAETVDGVMVQDGAHPHGEAKPYRRRTD